MLKKQRFKGNITLLALFVLLASALIGVLVSLFMRNFLRYNEEISGYEKANYAAKAGTELWLAMVNSRGIGFSYQISWDNEIMENFSCPFEVKKGECSYKPNFSLEIIWTGISKGLNPHTECTTGNLIEVQPGLSVIIPLFYDPWDKEIKGNLTQAINNNQQSTEQLITIEKEEKKRNFGIASFSNKTYELSMNSWTGNLSDIKGKESNNEAYLIIANPSTTQSQSLCIQSQDTNWISQETVKLISIGNFKDKEIWRETLFSKKLPDFLQGDNYLN